MRALPLAGMACLLAGCAYVGEPLPPLLNIPGGVTDLAAVQRGTAIIVQFTVPRLTTEGVALREPPKIDLRIGVNPQPFSIDGWAGAARSYAVTTEDSHARAVLPASEWTGREIVIAARTTGHNGRESVWSNLVVMDVVPPPPTPSDLRAEAVPEGVRLTWKAAGPGFRVFRKAGAEESFTRVADTQKPEWIDTSTQYGSTYRYVVQTTVKAGAAEAESEPSAEVAITPEDRFPPAVPSGLTAAVSTNSVELVWERNTEPDFAAYRVYRAAAGGAFERLGETPTPNYSDRKIEPGKTYRYAISSVDMKGNESARCPAVEATAP